MLQRYNDSDLCAMFISVILPINISFLTFVNPSCRQAMPVIPPGDSFLICCSMADAVKSVPYSTIVLVRFITV